MESKRASILDLEVAQDEPQAQPVIRRKRIKCTFCGGYAFVAQSTPDAERQACRDCRHLGYYETTKVN